jgi:hypothetical protein
MAQLKPESQPYYNLQLYVIHNLNKTSLCFKENRDCPNFVAWVSFCFDQSKLVTSLYPAFPNDPSNVTRFIFIPNFTELMV